MIQKFSLVYTCMFTTVFTTVYETVLSLFEPKQVQSLVNTCSVLGSVLTPYFANYRWIMVNIAQMVKKSGWKSKKLKAPRKKKELSVMLPVEGSCVVLVCRLGRPPLLLDLELCFALFFRC